MRKTSWSIILVLALATVTLGASVYPDLTASVEFTGAPPATYDTEDLRIFIEEWYEGDDLSTGEVLKNNTIEQLESVYRIQTTQLDQLRRQARPIISLTTDPANPLYGFSRVVAPNIDMSVGPPVMTDQTTLSHKFGLGLGLSQLLPTAGSVDLSLRHGITVSSADGGAWKWKQAPSASLSLRQPLALGESFLDTAYGERKEKRQVLVQEGAADAVRQASAQVELQAMRLKGTAQAIMESRWLALQQARIADEALSDARKDLELGLLSRNQVFLQEQALSQQLLQIKDLERELDSVLHSLETLLEQDVPLQGNGNGLIDIEAITRLVQFQGGKLAEDSALTSAAVAADADYRTANRDLMIAQLDRSLGNPADAPTFSLSMQISPYYDPSAGNGLWGSFDELFKTGEPVFSLSLMFQSSDLGRGTSKTTRTLADEQIVQASISKESADSAVRQKIRDFQMRIDTGLSSVGLLLEDYRYAVNAIEIERILSESYQGDTLSMERKKLARYGAAFSLLQHLRTMTLLSLELELVLGANNP